MSVMQQFEWKVIRISHPSQLRAHAAAWDDLWRRSGATQPTARAALIRSWCEHFRADRRFMALVVCQGDRFVAALPLVGRRKRGVISCWDLPGNEWSAAGDLLLDRQVDHSAVCDVMIEQLAQLEAPTLWFASLPIDTPWWYQLTAAARRAGWSIDEQRRYDVGYLSVPRPRGDGQRPAHTLPASLGKRMERELKKLGGRTNVRLHVARPRRGDAALGLLENGLRLEQAGWKGRQGTSVLSDPKIHRFVEDQARHLIEQRQLLLALLERQGEMLAFECGWVAKEVYHSFKVAYNEDFARHSPGQLLMYHLVEHFQEHRHVRAIDFLGPLDSAVRRWRPETYAMGRLTMGPPRAMSTAVVSAARWLTATR